MAKDEVNTARLGHLKPETFDQYLERTLSDSGLRSYGHNEFNRMAEQACYRRALCCFYSGPGSPPEGDDGPPWGIHTEDPREAHHEAALADDANVYMTRSGWHREPGADDTNPKDKAASSKVPMWSLPSIGAVHGAMATAEGIRKKYGAYNWRYKPISMMEHIGGLERHIAALKDGEDFVRDSKRKVTHLGCLNAVSAIILDAQQCGTLIDDRPKPGIATAADALEDYHGRNAD